MSTSKSFIGLIGLGYWGQNLLRNFYEMGVLHTACDASLDVLDAKRKQYPDAQYTTSVDDIMASPEIKAVAIAAPAVAHYDLAKRAIFAGKDVFVEKPLSLTVKQGEEIVALARTHGRVLMVGHILQYHPAVLKLRNMIQAGDMGQVRYIYSNRLNIGKFRTEENILWSFAPHDISVILMLLGEEPVKVNAFGGDYINTGINDVTMTELEFAHGVKGHVFVSWLHPFKEQKLVVVGSKAMAVFDDVSKEKLFLYPHKIEWKDGKIPVAQKAESQVIAFDAGEPLRLELTHFVECVGSRLKPRTDGEEGLKVLKILEAAEKALNEGKGTALKVENPAYFLHESSFVDAGAVIGEGTKIWHFSHVLKNTKVGRQVVIGQNVALGPDVIIGDRCKIQNNVSVYKGVTLEEDVFCGPSCVFTNVYNPRAFIERKDEFRLTLIKKGATIGANATIVCGATVGRYALVGAGAVVKEDVPDYGIAVGVPAKLKGWACRCGVTLPAVKNNSVQCPACHAGYTLTDKILVPVLK
ncbi:MAG: Gfo/Idh/MocA family oxidoreductase [Candidatus Omnitrophota bacterium]